MSDGATSYRLQPTAYNLMIEVEPRRVPEL
jgi:hypothetical protein